MLFENFQILHSRNCMLHVGVLHVEVLHVEESNNINNKHRLSVLPQDCMLLQGSVR